MAIAVSATGGKNYLVRASGCVGPDVLGERVKLHQAPGSLRLSSASWLIQEKAGFTIWWRDDSAPESLLLVCESRNSIKFETVLPNPQGWDHTLYISWFGLDRVPDPPCHFVLTLDFDR